MNFSELRSLSRVYVPQAKAAAISNTNRDIMLNEGVLDVALRTGCIKVNTKINITEEVYEYSLSSLLERYLVLDKPGIFWYDGTQWKKLYVVTVKWLDNKFPLWRDADSADPIYAAVHGDNLVLYPTPDTTLAEGLWVYYCQRPVIMSSDDHYPFHVSDDQEEELTWLAPLSESVLEYYEMKALKSLGKKEESKSKLEEYAVNLASKWALIENNQALMHSEEVRMRWGGDR